MSKFKDWVGENKYTLKKLFQYLIVAVVFVFVTSLIPETSGEMRMVWFSVCFLAILSLAFLK